MLYYNYEQKQFGFMKQSCQKYFYLEYKTQYSIQNR